MNIKKILSLLFLAIIISTAFVSCKSRDACPGMSQVKISQNKAV
ncbi:MAG: hypothetical protein P8I43_06890 [Bacteroidia bacterium]|nr:hypothetical protein [Bacteroidia bacterium]MDG2042321.1 hypothetical protein [Bacteroidia bacterium]